MTVSMMTLAEAARIVREASRDKSYQLTPLGAEVAAYLRHKRKRLADTSYRGYESSLDKLARHFADLELSDFEPPVGSERIEEYLDAHWGSNHKPGTYNTNHAITADFFKWAARTGRLHGNPMLMVERARKRETHRETFSADVRHQVIAEQESLRDRIALRLLFDYGLRKGTLQKVQFKHFDYQRRRLTVFLKRGKVRQLPIPDPHFWTDLERHILEVEAKPGHYLMAATKRIPLGRQDGTEFRIIRYPDRPMSDSAGMHRWWYGCLERAGIVPVGTSSGERMHKARHTAGQRVLDKTGNLKAVQKLLGHESIRTTADTYLDWDIDQLAATLADVLLEDE